MQECYLNTNKKSNCTGCGACMSICPKKAISMVEDSEGFRYPVIDKNKCINCKLCEKICPNNKDLPNTQPKSYKYITKNEKDLLKATSGGAFGDIVAAFFTKNNTYIYGCTYDENNKVIHKGVNKIEDIEQFKKSKYVQSNLLDVYNEIKKLLIKDNKVLFSGTPCQVAGLKSFLQKEYENLLLVDVVCHGTPSQKLFDYYINNEEKRYGSKITKVTFREKVKEKDGRYNLRNIKLEFDNKNIVVKKAEDSSYFFGFTGRLFYRPSCYSCKFASKNRYSDITICDVWGIDKNKNMGISGIIINTKKGKEIIDKIKGNKEELSLDYIIKINECYTKPTHLNKNRKKFFNNLNCDNFEKKSFKYGKKPFIKRSKENIKWILGKFKRKLLNK